MAALPYLRVFLAVCLLSKVALCHQEYKGSSKVRDRLVFLNNASEHFVEEIFEQYANNRSNYIGFHEFQDLLKRLNLRKTKESDQDVETEISQQENKESHQHGHRKRRKLETGEQAADATDVNITGTPGEQHHGHMKCIDGDHLLELHDISKDRGISRKDFVQLCPSLVYQVQSSACADPKKQNVSSTESFTEARFKVWGYGLLAITVISLTSLFAIAIIPLMGKAIYKKVMSFLVALAVGTLAGDALLHLVPHAFLDSHSEASHTAALWKALVMLAGIYAFFVVESFMRVRSIRRRDNHHHHGHHHHHNDHQNISKECETQLPLPCDSRVSCGAGEPLIGSRLAGIHYCRSREDVRSPVTSEVPTEIVNLGSLESNGIGNGIGKAHESDTPSCDEAVTWEAGDKTSHSFSDTELGITTNDSVFSYDDMYRDETPERRPCLHQNTACPENHKSETIGSQQLSESSEANENKNAVSHHEGGHDMHHHHHHHHGNKEIDTSTSIATIAWMVIVSDGFHNFSDGLAVGAAFTSSLTNGLTTSIAVFCHELPHELGDFAILIKSGLTFKQALAYNMASAVISYIGLALGIALGNIDSSHSWVLALTAGMFLYISLVSMLPELCSYQAEGGYSVLLSQNAGILIGVLIMLGIALNE